MSSIGAKVAWETVTKPKKEGAWGIRDIVKWNKSLNLKHIWHLFKSKGNSLWVNWVKCYHLKKRSFWFVKIPPDSAWYWRKLLKLRSIVRPYLKHRIGNGQNTYMRFDNWHLGGPIVERYGSRIVYDLGIDKHAKVDGVLLDGRWEWPIPNSWELMEVVQGPNIVFPNPNQEDLVYWDPTNGEFTASSAYDLVRVGGFRVEWYELVWHNKSIPRQAFVLSLAILHRPSTQDRVSRYSVDLLVCVLCS